MVGIAALTPQQYGERDAMTGKGYRFAEYWSDEDQQAYYEAFVQTASLCESAESENAHLISRADYEKACEQGRRFGLQEARFEHPFHTNPILERAFRRAERNTRAFPNRSR